MNDLSPSRLGSAQLLLNTNAFIQMCVIPSLRFVSFLSALDGVVSAAAAAAAATKFSFLFLAFVSHHPLAHITHALHSSFF